MDDFKRTGNKFVILRYGLECTKLELIQWLTTVEDIEILKKLLKIHESETKDSTYQLSDAENKAVDEGLEDLKNGDVVPHSEAKKIYGKWL